MGLLGGHVAWIRPPGSIPTPPSGLPAPAQSPLPLPSSALAPAELGWQERPSLASGLRPRANAAASTGVCQSVPSPQHG